MITVATACGIHSCFLLLRKISNHSSSGLSILLPTKLNEVPRSFFIF